MFRGLGIDSSGFAEWLGPRLGDLRFSAVRQQEMPTRKAELNALLNLRRKVLDASEALSGIYPGTSAVLHLELFRAGNLSCTLDRDLAQGLQYLSVLLSIVEKKFKEQAGLKRGPRDKGNRDTLLSDMTTELLRLGIPKRTLARKLAAEILVKCGIAIPSPDGRATQRAQKKGTLIRAARR